VDEVPDVEVPEDRALGEVGRPGPHRDRLLVAADELRQTRAWDELPPDADDGVFDAAQPQIQH